MIARQRIGVAIWLICLDKILILDTYLKREIKTRTPVNYYSPEVNDSQSYVEGS